jgi:hypothetical protein
MKRERVETRAEMEKRLRVEIAGLEGRLSRWRDEVMGALTVLSGIRRPRPEVVEAVGRLERLVGGGS